LTGRDLNRDFDQVFVPLHLAPNLFNYLFRPVRALPVFPFIKSLWGIASLLPLPIRLPPLYWSEQLTGRVVSTPFALFGGFLLWWLLCEDAPSQVNVPKRVRSRKCPAFRGTSVELWPRSLRAPPWHSCRSACTSSAAHDS
jgi:hypothetical protein